MSNIDTHLKLDGISGESKHKDHKDQIELVGWNWGVTNASSFGENSGGGKGKGKPMNMVIIHRYDKASPLLAKASASGKHIASATITARKSGEGQKDFLTITLKPVVVTSVQPSCDAGGEIVEVVSLAYEDVEFDYKPQDDKGGLGGSVKFGWNVASTETR